MFHQRKTGGNACFYYVWLLATKYARYKVGTSQLLASAIYYRNMNKTVKYGRKYKIALPIGVEKGLKQCYFNKNVIRGVKADPSFLIAMIPTNVEKYT